LIVLGIVGFVANHVLQRLERQALPWRHLSP
jgi:ABC-type nitrate/sulfonate/bicarbonate transport system permease component